MSKPKTIESKPEEDVKLSEQQELELIAQKEAEEEIKKLEEKAKAQLEAAKASALARIKSPEYLEELRKKRVLLPLEEKVRQAETKASEARLIWEAAQQEVTEAKAAVAKLAEENGIANPYAARKPRSSSQSFDAERIKELISTDTEVTVSKLEELLGISPNSRLLKKWIKENAANQGILVRKSATGEVSYLIQK